MKLVTTPDERRGMERGILHHLINEEEIKHMRFFSHVTMRKGEVVDYHIHEGEYEIYYIISGEGIYTYNNEETVVSKGAVTYCPSGDSHGIKNVSDTPLEFVAVIVVE